MQREFDVARQGSGGHPKKDLLIEVLEQFSEAVVVRLIHHHEAQIVEPNAFVVEAVVQGLHHGHIAPVFLVVFELLDLAVNDFVGHPNLREHVGGLAQQFNAVGQNQNALAGFQDVALGQLGENHCFPAPRGQLVQEVVSRGKLPDASHDLLNGLSLIAVEGFPLLAGHALGNFRVDGEGFGHGSGSSGKAQKYPLDWPIERKGWPNHPSLFHKTCNFPHALRFIDVAQAPKTVESVDAQVVPNWGRGGRA